MVDPYNEMLQNRNYDLSQKLNQILKLEVIKRAKNSGQT